MLILILKKFIYMSNEICSSQLNKRYNIYKLCLHQQMQKSTSEYWLIFNKFAQFQHNII
jgi:hypothetical protein